MFSKVYVGEVKKLIRPKTLLILAIIVVLFVTVYAITYEKMLDMADEMSAELDDEMPDVFSGNTVKFSEQSINGAILIAQKAVEEAEKNAKGSSWYLRSSFDSVYAAKSYLKALEHIKENKMYDVDIELYSEMSVFSDKSAEGFMKSMFGILLAIMIIYGIIIGAGSYAQEMRTGTLKMLFMRPITANKLTSAKLLAMVTMTTFILLFTSLLAYLYGLLRFGAAESQRILVVFNASSAFMSTKSLMLFFSMMIGVIQVFSYSIFAFALGAVTRNRVLPTILGILISMNLPATLLSLLKLGRFLFSTSMNFGGFFGIGGAIPGGSNFFIALPVYLAYMALFLASTYIIVNKRDLA
jgi:ABC-2 type transport system permease protein